MITRSLGLLLLLTWLGACASSRPPALTLDNILWDFCFGEHEEVCVRVEEESFATADEPASSMSSSYSLSGGWGIRFNDPSVESTEARGETVVVNSATKWRQRVELGYESRSLLPSEGPGYLSGEEPRYETTSEWAGRKYFGLKVEADSTLRYGWLLVTGHPRYGAFQVHDYYLGVEGETVVLGEK